MNKVSNYSWAITLCITVLGWVWVLAGDRSLTTEKLSVLEHRVSQHDQKRQTNEQRIAEIHSSMIKIRTDVQWIRDQLRRQAN